jgi:hypothetical protein
VEGNMRVNERANPCGLCVSLAIKLFFCLFFSHPFTFKTFRLSIENSQRQRRLFFSISGRSGETLHRAIDSERYKVASSSRLFDCAFVYALSAVVVSLVVNNILPGGTADTVYTLKAPPFELLISEVPS